MKKAAWTILAIVFSGILIIQCSGDSVVYLYPHFQRLLPAGLAGYSDTGYLHVYRFQLDTDC
jgi:hypothetical protein